MLDLNVQVTSKFESIMKEIHQFTHMHSIDIN